MVETIKQKIFFSEQTYPLYGARVIDENLNLLLRGMSEKKTILKNDLCVKGSVKRRKYYRAK